MRGSLATIALALVLTAGVTHAQPPNPAADAALEEGRRLYDLQEWDKAIAKFKEAYSLREDAAALFNIAQSYRLKGDCAQAASFYKTFKRNFPKEKNVDKFITEMEACAKNTPAPNPTTTNSTKTNPTKTNPTKTNPTTTNPTKTNPTTTNPTTTTTASAKDPTVATGPITEPTGPTGPTGPTEPIDRPTGSGGGLRVASYVSMGAGGAALVVGAIFGVKARGAAKEAEDLAMGQEWRPAIEERGLRNQRIATISLVAGSVLAAGGVVMFVLSRPSSEQSGVTLAPTTDGAQLVWAGSF